MSSAVHHNPSVQLIALILLAVGTSSVESVRVNLQSSCMKKDTDVLILGAGMAGISAAKTLSDGGVKDFIILEGRAEIGGRMWSQVLNATGARVELGANWIEELNPSDLDAHPLWRLAKQCGGLGGHFEDYLMHQRFHVFDQNGVNISNDKTFLSRLSEWNAITLQLNAHAKHLAKHHLPDITVRQALERFGWFPTTPIDRAIEWLGYDWEFAVTPDVSSFLFAYPLTYDYMYFVTDQSIGYVKLVHCLADSFLLPEDKRLHLSSVVKQIDWSPTSSCVCVTAVEDGMSNQYCASAAIVTFGLGVLKSSNVLFNPALPYSKLQAIRNDGFTFYLKLFLEFEEVFWTKDEVDSVVHVDMERGYYIHFQSLAQAIPGNPPIIFATLTGELAKEAYALTNFEIKTQMMAVLRTMFGEDIPDPLALTVPDLGKNPFYEGMYSYRPFTFTELDLEDLRANASCLYFAGEALPDNDGYVQSALMSGNQTAREVLKLFML